MTKFLISFHSSGMAHIPDEDWPSVGEASHAVVREAKEAGVWVFGGGIEESVAPVLVAEDGTVTNDTYPQYADFRGGFTVLEVPTRDEALDWAQRIAVACRCPQEVREFMYDPES
jgi:hypothetical protein